MTGPPPTKAPNIGAIILRIGFPLKGPIRVTKRDLQGFHGLGAFIIRIRFWGPIIL